MTTWLFQANPDQFDIDGCLSTSPPSVLWLAKQHISEMKRGDRVFLWRAIGRGDRKLSGVLAEGYLTSESLVQPDFTETLPFWKVADGNDPHQRVEVRLTRIELRNRIKRDWLEEDPILASSAIFRLRTGTNFRLSEREALRLNAIWNRALLNWSYAETVAGLWAFSRTLGTTVSRKPGSPVVEVALKTGRVLGGVYNKVMNFRALDPTDLRKGLSASSAMDAHVWGQFFNKAVGKLDFDAVDAEYHRLWPDSGFPEAPPQPPSEVLAEPLRKLSLAELLARYSKTKKGKPDKPRTYRTTSVAFERDPMVVAIARARAEGQCELEGCPHPLFLGPGGEPFLEVHHIHPLAAGGADTPENVACLCPSHHREAHHGQSATSIRASLENLRSAEPDASHMAFEATLLNAPSLGCGSS